MKPISNIKAVQAAADKYMPLSQNILNLEQIWWKMDSLCENTPWTKFSSSHDKDFMFEAHFKFHIY